VKHWLCRPLSEPLDIGVTRGTIVAAGRLACAGLIETHLHLDKSRIIDRCLP
jgi:hypothetical protein